MMDGSKFKIRGDLRFILQEGQSPPAYVIEDAVTGKYYRIGLKEYALAVNIDGCRGFKEVLESARVFLQGEVSEDEAMIVFKWLFSNQLLDGAAALQSDHLFQAYVGQDRMKRIGSLNLIFLKFPLINPDRFFDRIYPYFGWMTGRAFFGLWSLSCILGLLVFADGWDRFSRDAHQILAPENLPWIWVVWFGLKLLHEFYHSLICKKYGGRVREAGIRTILFMPFTYVDVTSSWMFADKWQRILTAAAGMYLEVFVASLAVFVWAGSPDSSLGMIARNTVVVASLSTVLFNANPLMRFDGYYILSDLIEIPNLGTHGQKYLRGLYGLLFFGSPLPPLNYAGLKAAAVRVYGVAALIWRILVMASMTIAASKLLHGWGIIFSALAIIVMMISPLYAYHRQIAGMLKSRPELRLRWAVLGITASCLVGYGLISLSWSKTVHVPGVVEFADYSSVRAETEGFVTDIKAVHGGSVNQGDTLMVLENPELSTFLRDVRLKLSEARLHSRMLYRKENLSGYQVVLKEISVLEEQETKLRRELEALTIKAPQSGMVVSGTLDELQGKFLKKGDEILWIADPGRKKLILSVDHEDVRSVRNSIGSFLEIDMRLNSLGCFRGKVVSVEPKATHQIKNLAMSAAFGGPVSVRPVETSRKEDPSAAAAEYESVSPRFQAEIELPPERVRDLWGGQLAFVRVAVDEQSLWSLMRRYLENKGI